MKKTEMVYTWTNPRVSKSVKRQLRDFFVHSDGRLFEDKAVIFAIQKAISSNLLNNYAVAGWLSAVCCVSKITSAHQIMCKQEVYIACYVAITAPTLYVLFTSRCPSFLYSRTEADIEELKRPCVNRDSTLIVYFALLLMCVLTFVPSCCVNMILVLARQIHDSYNRCTTTVATEAEACVVLRERLVELAFELREKGEDAVAERVQRLADSDFNSFSDMCFKPVASILIKGAARHTEHAGGGGGRRDAENKWKESRPLLMPS